MIFKAGVEWSDMDPMLEKSVAVIDKIHLQHTGKPATCTSARRPRKPGGSGLHPDGCAGDLRTWAFGDPETDGGKARVRQFAGDLRKALAEEFGPGFDVVVEGPAAEKPKYLTYDDGTPRQPHVHWEWDPRDKAA